MPDSTEGQPEFVSVAEAARRFGIARTTAYGLIKDEKFPVRVVKIGGSWKVDRAALDAFIEGESAQVG